jgi:hypothetical protein
MGKPRPADWPQKSTKNTKNTKKAQKKNTSKTLPILRLLRLFVAMKLINQNEHCGILRQLHHVLKRFILGIRLFQLSRHVRHRFQEAQEQAALPAKFTFSGRGGTGDPPVSFGDPPNEMRSGGTG